VQVRGVGIRQVNVDGDATELVVSADQQRSAAAESLEVRQHNIRRGVAILCGVAVVGDVGDGGKEVSGLENREPGIEGQLGNDSRAEVAGRDDDVVGPLRQRYRGWRRTQGRSAASGGGGPDVTERADPGFLWHRVAS
jgi:hypothetical protein